VELSEEKKPRISFGGRIVLKVMVVVAALLLANLLAYNQQYVLDVTAGRRHSLSESTVQLLTRVRQPMGILVFTGKWDRTTEATLKRFRKANPNVSYQFIDPAEQAGMAKQYGIQGSGTIVKMGDAHRRVGFVNEQNLAGAMLQLVKGGGKKIVFSEGHNELSMRGMGPTDLGKAGALLQAAGYAIVQAALTDETLKDARVVVIAGARKDLLPAESARVRKFVEEGGGLFVMLTPKPGAALDGLLTPYGIRALDDFVVELNPDFRHKKLGNDTIFVRAPQVKHPVTERITQAYFLSRVRSIEFSEAARGKKDPMPINFSSKSSWGETNFASRSVQRNPGVDHPGPRVLAAATIEPPSVAGKGRLFVTGTARYAVNRGLDTWGNRGFWEAAVSWLAGDLDYPLISQKEAGKKLVMNENQLRVVLVGFFSQ